MHRAINNGNYKNGHHEEHERLVWTQEVEHQQ